jgi:hypothetical protein
MIGVTVADRSDIPIEITVTVTVTVTVYLLNSYKEQETNEFYETRRVHCHDPGMIGSRYRTH